MNQAVPTNLEHRIDQVLAATIRPLLIESGGGVELAELTTQGVARLRFSGACRSCPSTMMTLLMGVERELIKQVPEVAYLEVVAE